MNCQKLLCACLIGGLSFASGRLFAGEAEPATGEGRSDAVVEEIIVTSTKTGPAA